MQKIMFNDTYLLTQAVLEGRKTMTRRIIEKKKNEYFLNLLSDEGYMKHTGTLSYDDEFGEFRIDDVYECTTCRPMYKIGEVVAVAQSYKNIGYQPTDKTPIIKGNKIEFIEFQKHKGWTNKMFVRADNMMSYLQIKDIKIEKLQDISYEDCLSEGIIKKWHAPACAYFYYVPGIEVKTKYDVYRRANEAFAALIDKVSGKGTWESNPYVFAYSFELVK